MAGVCWLSWLSGDLTAGQVRTPLSGPVSLGGREIEQFVLLQTIHVNHPFLTRSQNGEFWILPGQFIPVSQDARGFYFQATSGLRPFIGNGEAVPGGLYLSKKKPDEIFRYFGNARSNRGGMDIDSIPLGAGDVRLLKVAHSETHK